MITDAQEIRRQITDAKEEGRDTSALVARLIEIDRKPRKNKQPRVTIA